MPTYNVHEAKTNLSKLIERAESGEEVIIARRDAPAVRLVAIVKAKRSRQFGAYKGEATVTDAFFEPLPEEELTAWESNGPPVPKLADSRQSTAVVRRHKRKRSRKP